MQLRGGTRHLPSVGSTSWAKSTSRSMSVRISAVMLKKGGRRDSEGNARAAADEVLRSGAGTAAGAAGWSACARGTCCMTPVHDLVALSPPTPCSMPVTVIKAILLRGTR